MLLILTMCQCDSVWQRQTQSCLPESAQFDCKSHGWPCSTCLHVGDATDTQTRLNPVPNLWSTLMLLTSTILSSRATASALNCFSELHWWTLPQDPVILCLGALAFKERLDSSLNLETLLPLSASQISQGVRGEHLVQWQVSTTWC